MKPQARYTVFPQATRGTPAHSIQERAAFAQARMEAEKHAAAAARQAAQVALTIGAAGLLAALISVAFMALR